MEFNKELSGKRSSKGPSVVFRKLADTGNSDRYQGSINKAGVELIESIGGEFCKLQILFSDQHKFIGFKPLYQEKGASNVFGATELFKELPLVIGNHYELKLSEGVAVIDSNEFYKGQ